MIWLRFRRQGVGSLDLEDKAMKKCAVICLLVLLLGGCSAKKIWNWLDKMDWERDDQTVQTFDITIK